MPADFKILKTEFDLSGFILTFKHLNKNFTLKIRQPLPEHFSYSIVLAIAGCMALGVEITKAITAIEDNFLLPPGRMSIFKGINNSTIIDSSYNSSSLPLLDTLEFLNKIGNKKRKLAILGDMRELGIVSKELHEEAARKIMETTDLTILIGPLMKEFTYPILKENHFKATSFENFTDAASYILQSVKSGDMILVKGSQNTLFLERVVEMLLKNKEDVKKLCRRGDFWDKLRAKTL